MKKYEQRFKIGQKVFYAVRQSRPRQDGKIAYDITDGIVTGVSIVMDWNFDPDRPETVILFPEAFNSYERYRVNTYAGLLTQGQLFASLEDAVKHAEEVVRQNPDTLYEQRLTGCKAEWR